MYIIVSNTLLRPAIYYDKQNAMFTLAFNITCSTFPCRHAVVVSFIALRSPLLYPLQQSCRGVYWFHHVRPSVRPSVDKSYVVR
jgi:hypothetical protein